VLEGVSSCVAYFHSDGSVQDYGYKFTVVAHYPVKEDLFRKHWLLTLYIQLIGCMAAMSTAFVTAEWGQGELENAIWLENPLLSFNYPDSFECDRVSLFKEAEDELISPNSCEVDELLSQLTERLPGTLGAALAMIMKKRVLEDRGSEVVINRAIYTSCAAIIRHNNLGFAALAVAKGVMSCSNSSDYSSVVISDSLLGAWRSGQMIRRFFNLDEMTTTSLGEVCNDSVQSEERKGNILYITAEAVIKRGKFLLLSSLDSFSQESSHAAERERERVAQTTQKVLLFLQSKLDILRLSEIIGIRSKRASFRDTSFEWLSRVIEGSTFSALTLSLAVSTFSNMLQSMREKGIEKAGGKGSDQGRHQGLDRSDNQEAYLETHFLNGVQGANPETLILLRKSYFKCFDSCTRALSKAYEMYSEATIEDLPNRDIHSVYASIREEKRIKERDRLSWKNAVITSLRACSLDFDLYDHNDAFTLLSMLGEILKCRDREISELGHALMELLLVRTKGLRGIKGGPAETFRSVKEVEPTVFSKKLTELLVSRLTFVAKCAKQSAFEPLALYEVIPRPDFNPLKGMISIDSNNDSSGYSVPDMRLSLTHTG
jgi:hypothetical protein